MKSVSRLILLCTVLVIGMFAISGCQSAAKHEYAGGKATIEDARKLEAVEPDRAYDEYLDVKNSAGNDREKAAQALLAAARLESDPVKCCAYGGKHPNDPDLTPEVRDQLLDRRSQGQIKAHDAIKELVKDFGDTKAGQEAKSQNLLVQLEQTIDNQNRHSHRWFDRLSYAVIDDIVAMTGRQRGFSYWFALLLIAFIVKGVTLPLTLRMYKGQREMQRLQPAIKAMQEKYKGDQQELQKQTMAFYKEHGVNPFSSCFPMLIQFPFMIWIYDTIKLYEFHFAQGTFLWVNPTMARYSPDYIAANLGMFDFTLLVIYTASMYLTMKLTPATDPQAAQQQKTMSVMTTGMMFFFFIKYRWSAAFVFYWLILNLLSAAQSYYFVYKPNKDNPPPPIPLPALPSGGGNGSNGSGGKSAGSKGSVLTPAVSPSPATRPRRPRKPRQK